MSKIWIRKFFRILLIGTLNVLHDFLVLFIVWQLIAQFLAWNSCNFQSVLECWRRGFELYVCKSIPVVGEGDLNYTILGETPPQLGRRPPPPLPSAITISLAAPTTMY